MPINTTFMVMSGAKRPAFLPLVHGKRYNYSTRTLGFLKLPPPKKKGLAFARPEAAHGLNPP